MGMENVASRTSPLRYSLDVARNDDSYLPVAYLSGRIDSVE